jgi:hypothetical protein
MSKHHEEAVDEGIGIKLIGSPEALVKLMVKDKEERDWVINQIANDGPKHKQVLSALLLNRVYKLLQTTEKSSNTKFALQDGYEIPAEKNEHSPWAIKLPLNTGHASDKEEIIDDISKGPDHEVLTFAICLQVIEWAIKTSKNQYQSTLE